MQYRCFFINDAGAVEKIETAEFDDDRQARLWAESLAATCDRPVVIELWAPPNPVERYVVLEGARSLAPRVIPARTRLRQLSALFKAWIG
jgi:hypothetical protein